MTQIGDLTTAPGSPLGRLALPSVLGLRSDRLAPPALVDGLRALVTADAPPTEAQLEALGAGDDELVAALLALEPDAVARYEDLGFEPDVAGATLADVGRKHALYGAAAVLSWIVGLLRADVVQLGRLQVERRPDARGHALHIPEDGRLEASAVDDSLSRIAAFTGGAPLHCTSWLLDPAVIAGLPGSNLAAFAGRFEIVDPGERSDAGTEAVAKFVFRMSPAAVLDEHSVVPNTSLERLVAERLRAGYRWSEPVGVLVA